MTPRLFTIVFLFALAARLVETIEVESFEVVSEDE